MSEPYDDCLELLQTLVRRPSVTPDDAGCQTLIETRLESAGFHCESIPGGPVSNLWARIGDESPLLCFAGHTDVVPPGDAAAWRHDPFGAVIEDGYLYGRGTADMKSGLAAMIIAVERFLRREPDRRGSIAFLITSDEEGEAVDGTRRVVETLSRRGESIDWCVIGEPSSEQSVGDQVRIGRRGSLNGLVRISGVQGHAAYASSNDNPVTQFAPALVALNAETWDDGNAHFAPTGFHVVSITSGIGVYNVTPATLEARFNFRYSTESTEESLRERVVDILKEQDLDFELEWQSQGEPFITSGGDLVDAVSDSIRATTGRRPRASTGGGTSDGRFIAPTGTAVVEVGPVNASIHKIDECVRLDDLSPLVEIYEGILVRLLGR